MESDLVREILESAKRHPGRSWFAGLPEDHQRAIAEVRETWRRTAGSTGISATEMARVIVEKLTARGCRVAKPKQVQAWLTQG